MDGLSDVVLHHIRQSSALSARTRDTSLNARAAYEHGGAAMMVAGKGGLAIECFSVGVALAVPA